MKGSDDVVLTFRTTDLDSLLDSLGSPSWTSFVRSLSFAGSLFSFGMSLCTTVCRC